MTDRSRRYHAYLLRVWQVADGEVLLWRASLEAAGTGERRGFASLRELARWLEDQEDAEALLPGLDKEAPATKANS